MKACWSRKKCPVDSTGRFRAKALDSTAELPADFSNSSPLVTRRIQLILTGLAASVASGYGAGSIWTPAGDFISSGLTLKIIGQAYYHHPKMLQCDLTAKDSGFLTSVLCSA
jgi:hypothetical protein